MSIEQVNKQIAVYSFHGILISFLKGQIIDTCDEMDESPKHAE